MSSRFVSKLPLVIFSVFFMLWTPCPLHAKVTGPCADCHTMHNSQGGSAVATDSEGNLISTPHEKLLKTTCVGCHSNSTGNATIVNHTPIVLTASEPVYPTNGSASGTLAAGNFYWVLHATPNNADPDTSGHNCLAIPGVSADSHLSQAPGKPDSANGPNCAGCHDRIDSCKSCHTPAHHADDTGGGVIGASGGWYRYLNSSYHGTANTGVKGIEDPDWEQTVSASDHNEYNGCNNPYGNDDNSISNDCAGCHYKFHGINYTDTNGTVVADNHSPWFLHPTHLPLPNDTNKEYYYYNNPGGGGPGDYNPQAPVARDPGVLAGMSGPTNIVTPGSDQVMCLSCHRAHASPYPDMLRWNYVNDCQAGQSNANCGCFVCHTTKGD